MVTFHKKDHLKLVTFHKKNHLAILVWLCFPFFFFFHFFLQKMVTQVTEITNFQCDLDLQSVIPFWKELEYYKEYQKQLRDYLGHQKANEVLSESLYLISLGTNDFLENYYLLPGRRLKFSVEEYQSFLVGIAGNFITELFQLGARKISLGGLPPMGCLPLERTTNILSGRDCVEKYNIVAWDFNGKLQELVMKLKNELSGIRLVLTNPFDILLEIIQSPHSFGKFSGWPLPQLVQHGILCMKKDHAT